MVRGGAGTGGEGVKVGWKVARCKAHHVSQTSVWTLVQVLKWGQGAPSSTR